MKNKGFTLVEMLVDVGIIAILVTIAIVGTFNARQKARDARRKADLITISKALESFYLRNGYYPRFKNTGSSGEWCTQISNMTVDGRNPGGLGPGFQDDISKWLPNVPHDPLYENTPLDYVYGTLDGNGQTYFLLSQLETESRADDDILWGTDCNCNFSNPNYAQSGCLQPGDEFDYRVPQF